MVKRGCAGRCIFSPKYNARFNSKGQVTVFIIIGIVLLFAFAGILYLTKSSSVGKISDESEPIIASVPSEFKNVQLFTENCITSTAKEGLVVLGQQGGYIYPELIGKYSENSAYDADGVDLGAAKVPYWYYNVPDSSKNEFAFSSLQPKLYLDDDPSFSIEAQLSRYVAEKIGECLQNYSAFSEQGYVIDAEATNDVITTVGEENVNFWVKMKIKAQKGEAETIMEEFYVKVPLRLKHYYEVAAQINDMETKHRFLEHQALDLIGTYSAVDSNMLPPSEAVTFEVVPTAYWVVEDVKSKVKDLLSSHVPMLRYLGSDNFYRYEYGTDNNALVDLTPLYQKNYDNTILPLDLGQKVIVNFDYLGWDFYFDINDKDGKVEPSTNVANYMKLNLHTNHYYTSYDLSYPVLITISDAAALKGEGYNFVFAMESNLRNNRIIESGTKLPEPGALADTSMACDEDKKNTGLIKSVVVDSYTKEPLDTVQIGFSIPNQEDCMIGITNNQGEYADNYPAVIGGVGSYMKEGYLTNFYPIDTYQLKNKEGIIGFAVDGFPQQVVELHKYKTIKFSVRKKTLTKCVDDDCYASGLFDEYDQLITSYKPTMLDSVHSWVFTDVSTSLGDNESASVILNRVEDVRPGVYGDEFVAAATATNTEKGEIELVPGVYAVTILVNDADEVRIPKEERCEEGFVCTMAGGCCTAFDEEVLTKYISGQVQWNAPKYYFTLTPEQLYGSQEIVFYTLGYGLKGVPEDKRVIEDLQVMGQLGNYSQILRVELEPTYK